MSVERAPSVPTGHGTPAGRVYPPLRFLLQVLPEGFHQIPLRAAGQSHAQGRPLAHPRTARGRTTDQSRSDRRAAGHPAAAPVLRRPHDHHRDLRTALPAARTTAAASVTRETCVVIRHDLIPTAPAALASCGTRWAVLALPNRAGILLKSGPSNSGQFDRFPNTDGPIFIANFRTAKTDGPILRRLPNKIERSAPRTDLTPRRLKFEKLTAHGCGPRVRASKTFVRLPTPKTLQVSCRSQGCRLVRVILEMAV